VRTQQIRVTAAALLSLGPTPVGIVPTVRCCRSRPSTRSAETTGWRVLITPTALLLADRGIETLVGACVAGLVIAVDVLVRRRAGR
jgi:hypothetical protein